jgi:transcription termination factor Rho
MDITELQSKTDEQLMEIARGLELVNGDPVPNREQMLTILLQANAKQNGHLLASGILYIADEGYGFLKASEAGSSQTGDVYVSQSQIRRFSLRTGDLVAGQVRTPKDGERYFGLVRVEAVNGIDPDSSRERPHFEKLTPIFPNERIDLETDSKLLSTRLIDLIAPVGKGQRGLIVSPPKAGKTTLLKDVANGISKNGADLHLMVALIGERPEEVTDMMRSVKGEVYSSTFDEPVEDHCKVAEMVLERAKRLVEMGRDVVILLDSITRLTRAYNLAVPTSGRTLSGGIDPVALYPPKRFFGAARNAEDGGSLTILAACLVDTGSRMDDVIYEEFKGTGNMEVHLDRKLAEKRIYPAIDIARSGTRREELLLDEETLKQVWLLRRMLTMVTSDGMNSTEATEKVVEKLLKTKNNAEFLTGIGKQDI